MSKELLCGICFEPIVPGHRHGIHIVDDGDDQGWACHLCYHAIRIFLLRAYVPRVVEAFCKGRAVLVTGPVEADWASKECGLETLK